MCGLMKGGIGVYRLQEDVGVDDHLSVPGAIRKIECYRHIGHVYSWAELGCALPERLPGRVLRAQTGAHECVHRLAQPDMALALKHFGGRCDVVVQPDGRPHPAI
jgi:hypothetical protein